MCHWTILIFYKRGLCGDTDPETVSTWQTWKPSDPTPVIPKESLVESVLESGKKMTSEAAIMGWEEQFTAAIL